METMINQRISFLTPRSIGRSHTCCLLEFLLADIWHTGGTGSRPSGCGGSHHHLPRQQCWRRRRWTASLRRNPGAPPHKTYGHDLFGFHHWAYYRVHCCNRKVYSCSIIVRYIINTSWQKPAHVQSILDKTGNRLLVRIDERYHCGVLKSSPCLSS